ncbi:MAG TPA: DUF2219 domain-containing protein, partial [Alphaproteobacteria bacterium]|nr:DUF2219 domain-containing protein [Alphaproteobacteria bacterium]
MRYVFLPLLSLLTASNLALAAPEDGGMWTLAVENDALGAKTDKNYTSGLKILYRAPERLTPDFAWGLAQGILGADAQDAVFTTWAIGQSIYTPDDTKTALPLPDQHPYAGWLYGELGIHAQ